VATPEFFFQKTLAEMVGTTRSRVSFWTIQEVGFPWLQR